jgi:hypothetical protein
MCCDNLFRIILLQVVKDMLNVEFVLVSLGNHSIFCLFEEAAGHFTLSISLWAIGLTLTF